MSANQWKEVNTYISTNNISVPGSLFRNVALVWLHHQVIPTLPLNQLTVKLFSMSHFKPMDPLDYHISMPMGVQTLNFTQVPLQSSCADLRLKPHPLVNNLSIVHTSQSMFPHRDQAKSFTARNGRPYVWGDCFLKPSMERRREVAHPLPNKGFLQLIQETVMPFGPSSETLPLPAFLAQNPSQEISS